MRGILTSHILLSQKPDPRRCKSYTLIKKCKCVEFWNLLISKYFCTPLNMTLSLFDGCLWKYGLSFSFLFFSSWFLACIFFLMLFKHGYFFFFIFFFSIAHTYFWHMKTFLERERLMKNMNGVFIWWTEKHVLLCNSQCKSQHFICGCTWILIMGAFWESQQGSQQFDKAQHDNK